MISQAPHRTRHIAIDERHRGMHTPQLVSTERMHHTSTKDCGNFVGGGLRIGSSELHPATPRQNLGVDPRGCRYTNHQMVGIIENGSTLGVE